MADPLESHLLGQVDRGRIDFWHQRRIRIVLSRVPRNRPCVLADIGAGAGLLGHALRAHRPLARYRYFEPLDPVRSHLVDVFGAGGALGGPGDVGDADLVAALDVLEHVEDDLALLREIVDGTAANATVAVTVPALPSLWSGWDEQLGHHRRYTRSMLQRLGTTAGLDLSEVSYLFPELWPAGWIRRRRNRAPIDASEFPDLPRPLDRLLYGISAVTYKARRAAPVGTSLLAIGRPRPT